MLSTVMLNVIMLIVIILSVVAPFLLLQTDQKAYSQNVLGIIFRDFFRNQFFLENYGSKKIILSENRSKKKSYKICNLLFKELW
jgi:hypothetical protein